MESIASRRPGFRGDSGSGEACASAGPPPRLARHPTWRYFEQVYRLHVGANGVAADDPAAAPGALAAIARTHRQEAAHRADAEPVVTTSAPPTGGRLFDVITDEMPFAVESLLAGLDRAGARVRQVVHPVVTVRRDKFGDLVEVLVPGETQPGSSAELWIRIEVEPGSAASGGARRRVAHGASRRAGRRARPAGHGRGGSGGGLRAPRHAPAGDTCDRRRGRGAAGRVAGRRAFGAPRLPPVRRPRTSN